MCRYCRVRQTGSLDGRIFVGRRQDTVRKEPTLKHFNPATTSYKVHPDCFPSLGKKHSPWCARISDLSALRLFKTFFFIIAQNRHYRPFNPSFIVRRFKLVKVRKESSPAALKPRVISTLFRRRVRRESSRQQITFSFWKVKSLSPVSENCLNSWS